MSYAGDENPLFALLRAISVCPRFASPMYNNEMELNGRPHSPNSSAARLSCHRFACGMTLLAFLPDESSASNERNSPIDHRNRRMSIQGRSRTGIRTAPGQAARG